MNLWTKKYCTHGLRYTEIMNYNVLLLLYCLFRKDVRLPVQLQRAMAAEAEAAREARAKVKKKVSLLEC